MAEGTVPGIRLAHGRGGWILLALVSMLAIAASLPPTRPSAPAAAATRTAALHDRFLVRFREGSPARDSVAARNQALAVAGQEFGVQLRAVLRLAVGADVVTSDRPLDAAKTARLLQRLAANPHVEYAEIDGLVQPAFSPDDTYYASDQWDLFEAVGGIGMPAAWEYGFGTDTVVAVVDTGLAPHTDLTGQVVAGYDFIADPAVAVDGGGRDADPNDPGDYLLAGDCGGTATPTNSSWHGTHVAGTIAALANNAKGIAGIAYGAKVQPLRALGKCGGYDSDIADAIVWAAGGTVASVPANATPAEVINLSVGRVDTCNATVQAAIDYAHAQGVVVVVAAGNEAIDASGSHPANCNHALVVQATGRSGELASYSNYGSVVDVSAPGGNAFEYILSTFNSGAQTQEQANYAYAKGTSMAAPHVAAVAAIMQGRHANTPDTVEAILEATGRALPGACSPGCNARLIDARRAVAAADGPRLFIRDVGPIVEGDSGTQSVPFEVVLSQPLAVPVTFDVVATNGTATAGSDFVALNLVGRMIPAGSTSLSLSVSIVGDTIGETTEAFSIGFANLVNVANGDGATVTISDIDPRALVNGEDSEHFALAAYGERRFYIDVPAERSATSISYQQTGAWESRDLYVKKGAPPTTTDFDCRAVSNGCSMPSDGQAGRYYVLYATANPVDDTWVHGVYYPFFRLEDAAVAEGPSGGGNVLTARARLSSPAPDDVVVYFALQTGTAMANDWVIPSQTSIVTIPKGQTVGEATTTTIGDSTFEPNETVIVGLGNSPSSVVMVDNSAALTILNDDGPTLSIADASGIEDDPDTATLGFRITLSENAAADVSFDVTVVDDTATGVSGDFEKPAPTRLTIAAGNVTQLVEVPVLADGMVEPNETFRVLLSNASSNATIFDGEAVGTILNDDGPTLSIAPASVAEGNSGTKSMTFVVSLSQAALVPVTYDIATANGTATAGVDYVAGALAGQTIPVGQLSRTFTVTVNADTAIEVNEDFTATISSATGASILVPTAAGTILNDDGLTLSVGDAQIVEGNSGSKYLSFPITLSQPAPSMITYHAGLQSGTATVGIDTGIPIFNEFYIAAGATSASYQASIEGDLEVEPNETFFLSVGNTDVGTVLDGTGVGTIINDDGPTLSIGDISVVEGNSGTRSATFTVTLSQPAAAPVTYTASTANGSAKSGSDYLAKSAFGETIPAGQTSRTFTTSVYGDTLPEDNEYFYVNLSDATGASISDGQGKATIRNDEGPTLSVSDVTITEGNSGTRNVTFTVSLSQAATVPVTYTIATGNGTAVAGSDFTARTLVGETIPAGQLARTFTVTAQSDTVVEANETFTANLSAATGATILDNQGQARIVNDDGPLLRLNDVSITEGDSGTKTITFTVTLSPAASKPVTYYVNTLDGTAGAGSDYVARAPTFQNLPAGVTSKVFGVSVKGDTYIEPAETFNAILTNATGATIFDATGTATITNDD
jgi:subtilisin family serine protease